MNTETQKQIDAPSLLKPNRKITGISAILLPFLESGDVDWESFEAHVARTIEAGLIPAVNMDTGYVHLLDEKTKMSVLRRTQQIVAGKHFVAGAFVKDAPGVEFGLDHYLARTDEIQQHGGTPVIFQSFGLTLQSDDQIVNSYQQIGRNCDEFIGFELAPVFAPFGKVYSLDVYRGLISVPNCIGSKHSSLNRELEWQRLTLRDEIRPEFKVFTGNDLAIDMVMYGSDYLLGLSTFAPDLFAKRDAYWAAGDHRFYELNDWLQYLGFFAFRPDVPAYKHSAAMFLHQRGWIKTARTHPESPARPESDRDVLNNICDMCLAVSARLEEG